MDRAAHTKTADTAASAVRIRKIPLLLQVYENAPDASSAASAAHGRANDAYSLASGKASQTEMNNVLNQIGDLKARVLELERKG